VLWKLNYLKKHFKNYPSEMQALFPKKLFDGGGITANRRASKYRPLGHGLSLFVFFTTT
jgi:hypothetical protein